MDMFYTLEEVRLNTFYKFPKELLISKKYNEINDKAKLLYMILLDRVSLSIQNKWVDKENKVYIIFSREEAMSILRVSKPTIAKLFKELDDIGLIEDKQVGLKKANMIYVKKIHLDDCQSKDFQLRLKNFTSRGKKTLLQEVKKLYPNNTYCNNTYCNNTDCPEDNIEQTIEQIETKNDLSESDANNNIINTEESVITQKGNSSESETNNKKGYTIKYLREIYDYDSIIGHYDSNVVDEVLSEILNSINKSGEKLKICGSKKEKTEKYESIDVFTSRILKFNKNNIVNIVKKVLEEMKEHEITHVDLFVRTLCINESSSYIKDKTRGKKQKELNTQNTEYKVPQELNYEQRVYTDEQVDGYCENYWDKYPK